MHTSASKPEEEGLAPRLSPPARLSAASAVSLRDQRLGHLACTSCIKKRGTTWITWDWPCAFCEASTCRVGVEAPQPQSNASSRTNICLTFFINSITPRSRKIAGNTWWLRARFPRWVCALGSLKNELHVAPLVCMPGRTDSQIALESYVRWHLPVRGANMHHDQSVKLERLTAWSLIS